MRKKIIVGLLCLAMFLAAYVGGIVATTPPIISCGQNTLDRTAQPSGDEGGSQKPFARICGDEGGPEKPFSNQTGL
jgi:hypothetical protein